MDAAMREELAKAGMDEQQAEVLVSHWSQLATKADLVATKQDLELQLRNLRVSVRENMAGLHENDITIQKELVRFMGPALVAIVTGITTGGLALLKSHLLS